jgi:hypothetical protein
LPIYSGSLQLIEQCLGPPQIRDIETLNEPAIDRCQEIAGLHALTLIAPKLGEAGGGAQFPVLGTLALGDIDGLGKLGFRCGDITPVGQQCALDTIYLSIQVPRAGALEPGRRLVYQGAAFGCTGPTKQRAASACMVAPKAS